MKRKHAFTPKVMRCSGYDPDVTLMHRNTAETFNLWPDFEHFLVNHDVSDNGTTVTMTNYYVRGAHKFMRTGELRSAPISHRWATAQGLKITLCDEAVARLFDNTTTMYIRVQHERSRS